MLRLSFLHCTMQEGFSPFSHPIIFDNDKTLLTASENLNSEMQGRRSVRKFSDKSIPKEVIDNLLRIAASAPSGAHKQPWTFCVISTEDIKALIREAAEKEEYTNYHGRMSEEWLENLKKFGTDWYK